MREKREKKGGKEGEKGEKTLSDAIYLNDAILSLRRPEIETS